MASSRVCTTCSKTFGVEPIETAFLERLSLPLPRRCASCRRQRRLAHWPFGILQRRKCDYSGENIISAFSPNCRFPVYKRELWFDDSWQPPQLDIDWSRSFISQLFELQSKTPHFHQLGHNHINCEYADDVWECRNLYVCRSVLGDEDLLYSYRVVNSRDSADLTYCFDCEHCYECTYCFRCYNLFFSLNCRECRDSRFLYDCRGVHNCFMCWNLRNSEYCVLNQHVGEKEYKTAIAAFDLGSRGAVAGQFQFFLDSIAQSAIHRAHLNYQAEDCTGNYITQCKDCREVYFLEKSRDCANIFRGLNVSDCMDTSGLLDGELCYEICQSTNLNNVQFATFAVNCHDCQYIDQCFDSSDLFGCVGLKRKRFCILNKQYAEREYRETVWRVIEHMRRLGEYGEFFPFSFAYTGFNLSLGSFYYRETKDSIDEKGGSFDELPPSAPASLKGEELPEHTSLISDALLHESIQCQASVRPYRFASRELDFYRKHGLALPSICPEERNLRRFQMLAPPEPREIRCADCRALTTTYYPAVWQWENILCQRCYEKRLY